MTAGLDVYLEAGTKRVFASALEWPGWSRSGRGEDDAIETLVAYAPRYARVAKSARLPFAAPRDSSAVKVVERLKGGSGTDFGVPGLPAARDKRPVDAGELKRLQALLRGSWSVFDKAAAGASGVELRKGPRGGGRDLDKLVTHVLEADDAYMRQLGARHRKEKGEDPTAELKRLRSEMLDALARRVRGEDIPDATAVRKPWLPRYFVRRVAWHVLDHAWEIEDRAIRD